MVLLSNSHSADKSIDDHEFGRISIKRSRGSTISIRPKTDGTLVATLPYFVSSREVRRLVDSSRDQLRAALKSVSHGKTYSDGDKIGKSHTLHVKSGPRSSTVLRGLEILVTIREGASSVDADQLIRDGVAKALRKEAKAYLPRRLRYLSMQTGLNYDRVRFTHAKSRWGSCSSSGTISLNIMLMTLPNELIDYVLLHELTHTKHMNHSAEFWRDLELVCPGSKQKRKLVKQYSPYL